MWEDRIRRFSFRVWNIRDPCLIHWHRGTLLLAIYRTMYPDMGKPASYCITPTLQHCMSLTKLYDALTQSPFFGLCSASITFLQTQRFGSWLFFFISGQEAHNLVSPLDQAIFSHWANAGKHSTCEDMRLRTN